MWNISRYLHKFKNLTPKQDEVRESIINILKEDYNIEIDKENISYRNKKVFISTHPLIKNEIFINKKKLLDRIKEKNVYKVEDIH